jgi:hypothetical protein
MTDSTEQQKQPDFRYETGSAAVPWRAVGEAVTSDDITRLVEFLIQPVEGKSFREWQIYNPNFPGDANYAITLPNHVTMITSRGVAGEAGHNWSSNSDPSPTDTIASNKGSYVAGGFDVAHDNGLRTGIWSGKSKFGLFQQSFGPLTGAPDATGFDNGRDKIDYDKVEALRGLGGIRIEDDVLVTARAPVCWAPASRRRAPRSKPPWEPDVRHGPHKSQPRIARIARIHRSLIYLASISHDARIPAGYWLGMSHVRRGISVYFENPICRSMSSTLRLLGQAMIPLSMTSTSREMSFRARLLSLHLSPK